VVIDLEDAIGPAHKSSARRHVSDALSQPDERVVVRINSPATGWFAQDVELCREARPAAVMLPKAASVATVAELHARVGARILPLVESAEGIAQARALARAPGVERLVFGSLDFQLDLGLSATEDELLPFRCELVLASRLAGIAPPVDGVTASIDDDAHLAADAHRAVRLGFGAKLCIHPRQLATVHAAFSPSHQLVAWARRVIETVEREGSDAVALDGAMVDQPVIEKARRVLEASGEPVPTKTQESA
jgi:citrate lyase subunit beta / citryl-CoA lyase